MHSRSALANVPHDGKLRAHACIQLMLSMICTMTLACAAPLSTSQESSGAEEEEEEAEAASSGEESEVGGPGVASDFVQDSCIVDAGLNFCCSGALPCVCMLLDTSA